MMSTLSSVESSLVRPLPGWARGATADPRDALVRAGAMLLALDAIIRAEPPWTGAWRNRLALKAAATTIRHLRRTEDEAQLRDVWALRGRADPGPAGNVLAAWRDLVARAPMLDDGRLTRIAALLGAPLSPDMARAVLDHLSAAEAPARTPVGAAAAFLMMLRTVSVGQGLALWLTDLLIARKAGWPRPLPLLGPIATARLDGGEAAAVLARGCIAALDLAADLERRGATLLAVVPKLRVQQAGIITALLSDDALAPSAVPNLSDRAGRRVFDRLVALGAVRELTGRATFRLYGL